jgi:hypothetical protein
MDRIRTPRKRPREKKFFRLFLKVLSQSHEAADTWWNEPLLKGARTKVCVDALCKACKGFAPNGRIAAKGNRDQDRRAEYFTLDVVAWKDLGRPAVVAEHELEFWKIRDCAWKLLCVDADLRVLVAYFPSGNSKERCTNAKQLVEKTILPVLRVHPRKTLLIIVGDYNAPRTEKRIWSTVFSPWIGVGPSKVGAAPIVRAGFRSSPHNVG